MINLSNNKQELTIDDTRFVDNRILSLQIDDLTPTVINDNFLYLNSKLNENRRNIKYLDLYDVIANIKDADKIQTIFNKMEYNKSIFIGTQEPFEFQGEIYKKGDILLKNNNGNPIKIEGSIPGIYVPFMNGYEYNSENNYYELVDEEQLDNNINWNYSPNSASISEFGPVFNEQGEIVVRDKINFKLPNNRFILEDSNLKKITPVRISIGDKIQSNVVIFDNLVFETIPQIRFYYKNNNEIEEIFINFTPNIRISQQNGITYYNLSIEFEHLDNEIVDKLQVEFR